MTEQTKDLTFTEQDVVDVLTVLTTMTDQVWDEFIDADKASEMYRPFLEFIVQAAMTGYEVASNSSDYDVEFLAACRRILGGSIRFKLGVLGSELKMATDRLAIHELLNDHPDVDGDYAAKDNPL